MGELRMGRSKKLSIAQLSQPCGSTATTRGTPSYHTERDRRAESENMPATAMPVIAQVTLVELQRPAEPAYVPSQGYLRSQPEPAKEQPAHEPSNWAAWSAGSLSDVLLREVCHRGTIVRVIFVGAIGAHRAGSRGCLFLPPG
jgi:hypothetical protein